VRSAASARRVSHAGAYARTATRPPWRARNTGPVRSARVAGVQAAATARAVSPRSGAAACAARANASVPKRLRPSVLPRAVARHAPPSTIRRGCAELVPVPEPPIPHHRRSISSPGEQCPVPKPATVDICRESDRGCSRSPSTKLARNNANAATRRLACQRKGAHELVLGLTCRQPRQPLRSQRPLALTKPPFHRSHGLMVGSGSMPGKALAGTQPGVLKRNAPQHRPARKARNMAA